MNIKFKQNFLLDVFVVLFDIFAIIAANCILVKVFFGVFGIQKMNNALLVVYIISTIFMFYTYDFYTKMIRNKYELILSIGISIFMASVITGLFQIVFLEYIKGPQYLYYIFMPSALFVIFSLEKLLLLKIIKRVEGAPKLLVIESKDVVNDLARKVKYSYAEIYKAWYIQLDVNDKEKIDDVLNNTLDEYDGIFISPSISDELRDKFVSRAVNLSKTVYILPDLYNVSFMKSDIVQFDDTPAIRMSQFKPSKIYLIVKRIFDILFSLIGIIALSPVMIICAIAIKLDSPGKVIYKQERLTENQKVFKVYKFRTMYSDAEKHTGAVLATDDDPRITRVGKTLRSLRVDELPQLFNILGGSMSIVGPRPERPEFVKQFLVEVENYDKRFFVKAGLTGFAQVYARYNTSSQDKILYDMLYIRGCNIWLDLKIILLTFKIIFVKDSSDGVKSETTYNKTKAESGIDV